MKRPDSRLAAHLRATGRRRAAVALVVAPVLAGAWLLTATPPAQADGGPHIAAANSGASTLTADSCAGCHRAHTAQAALLLVADEGEICLTCHGTNGLGAATNVEDGVQYATANDGTFGGSAGPVIGALRSGGFVNARIDSSDPFRSAAPDGSTILSSFVKVSVLAAGRPVTSAHLGSPENGLAPPATAWGN